MKSTLRRVRRSRATSKETATVRKDKTPEHSFFSAPVQNSFFAPSGIQRKCADCEAEEAQRAPEKKEEKVMKAGEKKEEEKVMKAGEKKEEEKVQKASEKKEEEKVMKAPEKEEKKVQKATEKKEEEKVMKAGENKEEEKVQKAGAPQEEKVQKKEAASSGISAKVSGYIGSLNGKGQPLPATANAFFSRKMGYNFSGVKIHNDKEAAESAKAIRAKAYTTGKHIVFNEGKYDDSSAEGRHLLAHELTHVVQQNNLQRSEAVQRVDYDECNAAERTIVRRCHDLARSMMWNAMVKLFNYNRGATAPDVVTALRNRFAGTSRGLAGTVALNMYLVYRNSGDPTYECEKPQDGNTLGWSMWCVPFTDIELYPLWFGLSSDDLRAETIIHEWMHRYGCLLDLGYHEGGTSGSHGTLRSLNNADAYSNLCLDLK